MCVHCTFLHSVDAEKARVVLESFNEKAKLARCEWPLKENGDFELAREL